MLHLRSTTEGLCTMYDWCVHSSVKSSRTLYQSAVVKLDFEWRQQTFLLDVRQKPFFSYSVINPVHSARHQCIKMYKLMFSSIQRLVSSNKVRPHRCCELGGVRGWARYISFKVHRSSILFGFFLIFYWLSRFRGILHSIYLSPLIHLMIDKYHLSNG